MKLVISPKKILSFLFTLIVILLAGHIIGQLLVHLYPDVSKFEKFAKWMNFNREVNFPSLFSAGILFISSILLAVIGVFSKNSEKPFVGWYGLSLVFYFLAIDEAISIHEMFNDFGRKHLGIAGVFYYGWIIPYGLALLVLVGIYVPFLKMLPRDIAILFMVSGSIFVLGAVGFEMLGGRHKDLYTEETNMYIVYFTFEELLEMSGISLFIYTLLRYISDYIGKIKVSFVSVSEKSQVLDTGG
jgi:hypothetical protein